MTKNDIQYRASNYSLSSDELIELYELDGRKSISTVIAVWIEILAIMVVMQYVLPREYFWWAYIPITFLIAGRQGALLQLAHEGTHGTLAKSKRLNQLLANWFCTLPVGVSFEGFTTNHLRHHAGIGTEDDPRSDVEKYRVTDFRKPVLYLLLIKDLLGITALMVFWEYTRKTVDKTLKRSNRPNLLIKFVQLCVVQLVILLVLFHSRLVFDTEPIVFGEFVLFDSVAVYVLLWLIPALSSNMFLMRFRGIAEHGLSRQLGVHTDRLDAGMYYTRSFFTSKCHYSFRPLIWIERMLIGSFNINYHHEHHLYPKVPWYNLPKLHALVSDQVVERHPDIYARGYFSAALRNILPAQ